MKNKLNLALSFFLFSIVFLSCSKDDNVQAVVEPSLIIKFKFDSNQVRLNNLGQVLPIPAGNAGQNPIFNSIAAHYFELAPTANTALGAGAVLYHAPETTAGGATAIDYSQSKIVAENETFLKVPLKNLASGSYQYVRVSLSYQNFKVVVHHQNQDYDGTFASFVGYNTYLGIHNIGNNTFPVNGNRAQGYWEFALNNFPYATSGQAPAGATTVPNPLFATSPIPAGSCVVTGKFANDLIVSGNETKDINITLSLSINKSFEWKEVTADGKFEPSINEQVVDMGLRGLIPSFAK